MLEEKKNALALIAKNLENAIQDKNVSTHGLLKKLIEEAQKLIISDF